MSRGIGQNLPRAKQINRSLVLEQILFHGPMSRQQIAKNLGLTSATITNFTGKLIREGLLYEVGYVDEERMGRKSVTLGLQDNRYAVMAIHLRASDMEIGFVGLQGGVTKRRLVNYPTGLSKSFFLQFLRDQINMQFELRNTLDVVAIGVGSRALPLQVSGDKLIISKDYHMETVALEKEIASYVDVPLFLRSNTAGMAMAEKMYGQCKQTDNFMLVYMGPKGIGSGLILNGELCKGTGISAMGFGHMFYSEDGPECSCGRRGCLELYASELSILESCSLTSTNELIEHIMAGEPRVLEAIDEAARKISVVLLSFISMIDLHRVVFGGTLPTAYSEFVSQIQKNIQDNAGMMNNTPIEMSTSSLGSDLGIVGAAAPAIFEYIIRGDEFPEKIE